MKFLDQAKVYLKAGDGGSGCIAFRREKYVEFGGPAGGDGGRGGDVIAETADGLNTLIDFRYRQHFKAGPGQDGMGSNRTGANGKPCILRVPPGTQIFTADNNALIGDLTADNSRIVLCHGGHGGHHHVAVAQPVVAVAVVAAPAAAAATPVSAWPSASPCPGPWQRQL